MYGFVRRVLARLRWITLAALLLLTLVMPSTALVGVPTWGLVGLFALYSLLADQFQRRLPARYTLTRGAILDLPVAALLYFVAAEPGGPLFILFFFAVDAAAACLTVRGTLTYTAAAAALAAASDLTLLMWTPTPVDVRLLFVRLIALILVGVGMAIVMRRLVLEQALAQSSTDEADRLAQLDQLRAGFIASVSHELRTPLTAARAALALVETSALTRLQPDEQKLMSNARRNIERLSILLGDLLTFNQFEAGMVRLDRTLLDVRLVVTDSLSAIYPLILEKGQTLEILLPDPLPYAGDQHQLEQVLVNLLSNAHRHTVRGTHITIAGQATAQEILLTVSDNGPGIPQEELADIFKRFYRLRPGQEGSGLGLGIAKAIVELHGGRLWAESTPGQGARFHIALPRDAAGAPP